MDDHSTEMLELQKRQGDDAYARGLLGKPTLLLGKNLYWILNHIDCFVSQSRGNESIKEVYWYPYFSFDRQSDEFWGKVGQAVGNFQELKTIAISTFNFRGGGSETEEEDEDPLTSNANWKVNADWKVLARILSHVRQKVRMDIGNTGVWGVNDSRLFARAIRGHHTITSFDSGYNLP
jgi:hypothetical protein